MRTRSLAVQILIIMSFASVKADIVAHWRLDETSGPLVGSATWVPGSGKTRGAISLSRATGDLVNMGDVLGMTDGDFSITLWISTTDGSQNTFAFAKHQYGSANGYFFSINVVDGPLGTPGRVAFDVSDPIANDVPVSTSTVTDGAWHHVVGVYHAGGTTEIYVDGGAAEDVSGSHAVAGNSVPLLVGGISQSGSPVARYSGMVDDVQVYRQALTPDQVQWLYDRPGQALPRPYVSDRRFFRISSWDDTRITAFTRHGWLTWSNAFAGGTCAIERAESLVGSDVWEPHVQQPVTSQVMHCRVADLHPPEDMVLVPGGVNSGTAPGMGAYSLATEGFYMDATEITWAKWQQVRDWSVTQGYDLASRGAGKAPDHPVQSVNWYDCVKWCNARSQMEGLEPCYHVAGAVYTAGHSVATCEFTATGYRLPTTNEWEYAARGGLTSRRYPWGDTISHRLANYYSCWSIGYDVSPTAGWHPAYDDIGPFTSPVRSFAPNGYELFDMAGNVWELNSDIYDSSYRPIRGGGFEDVNGCGASNANCRVSVAISPEHSDGFIGFRSVRRL